MSFVIKGISLRRLFGLILLLAVSSLAFHAVLVGSLPLDAVDDYARIVNAKNASWVDIGQAFFSGRQSFSLLQNSITSLTDRIGQTLFLTILYNLFGERAVFYYYFQYSMGALTMALLAYFSFRLTRSLWLSMFAALFYFFLSPAFMHNIWLSDFAETVHVLILIFLYLNRRYFRKERLPDNAGGLAQIVLLILLAFLALKTKPSGYIIPPPLNIVYNDYHNQALTTNNRFEDIIRFIHPDYVERPLATTIYDLTTYCDIQDIGIKFYDAKTSDSALKKYGKVYWITRDSKMPPEGFRLIREARMIPESPITHLLAPYKAKKNQEMLLVFGKTLT